MYFSRHAQWLREMAAATKIQKVWRGYKTRKGYNNVQRSVKRIQVSLCDQVRVTCLFCGRGWGGGGKMSSKQNTESGGERSSIVVERRTSESRGPGFDPHKHHRVVSLSKTH